jgi:predicted transposase YbfD/YdcC
MARLSKVAIRNHFVSLKDPRVRGRTQHRFLDIMVIAICGVIADCDSWREIELFAQQRAAWFKRFLSLRHGIPSHDTLERVFDRIDPRAFSLCFVRWVKALSECLPIAQIAIDGKTVRRSFNDTSGLGPLHLVSAWATQQHLTLGQVAVDGKSNEITAIPQLLELLDLKGALVTLDAMGCQKDIADKIVAGGGDYVLTVKDNQERLHQDIQATIERALDGGLPAASVSQHESRDRGHGREELRSYVVVSCLDHIRDQALWSKLRVVGMCYSERTAKGKTSAETRYFIGSRAMSAQRYGQTLRNHWSIENSLHWQLDVSFGEDDSRVQKRHAAANLSQMRRGAISLLKQNCSKLSLRGKRKKASLNTDFLVEILRGHHQPEKV